jgi:hypothetical protein
MPELPPQATNSGAASRAHPAKAFIFRVTIHSSVTGLQPESRSAPHR